MIAPEPDSLARSEEPVVVPMSSVQAEQVRWLWPDRIPRGKLTLLEGDPGVAKSWLSLAIVTAFVNGGPFPGMTEPHPAGRALLLTAEDGLADTLRPRLDGLGADPKRVEVFRGMRNPKGEERPPSLAEDLWAVDEMTRGGLYGLLIVDPLNAYLPSDLDAHRDVAVRSVLAPLAQLAERNDVAVVAIRHLTKGARDRAIYRGLGSIAYTAAARVVLLVGFDPGDQSKHRRVVLPVKNNLAPLAPALAFEIRSGRFLWIGESDVTAEALLAPDPASGEWDQRDEAVDTLREVLAEGPVNAKTATAQLKLLLNGVERHVIRRARKTLGVQWRREGYGPGSQIVWFLPGSETSPGTIRAESDPYDLNADHRGAAMPIGVIGPMSTPLTSMTSMVSDELDDDSYWTSLQGVGPIQVADEDDEP